MLANDLTGGCLCGAVRYRTSVPKLPPTLCHCVSCRRAAGAHAVGLYTVDRDQMAFTLGQPVYYPSSPNVLRGLCGRCGTALTYWHAHWPTDISVTVASLDDPELAAPADHTWMTDASAWDRPADGLPQHQTDRP
jgi:hypothetical protein